MAQNKLHFFYIKNWFKYLKEIIIIFLILIILLLLYFAFDYHNSAHQLNNTGKAEIDVIFFNRVAKAGSESMLELMQNLGKIKNFKVTLSDPKLVNPRQLSEKQQFKLAQKIIEYDNSTIYVEHQNYIDFKSYKLPKPIYVNIVRDPVERLISWYFYSRSPWIAALRMHRFSDYKLKPEEWYRKDFNECVRTGDPECVYERFSVSDTVGDYRRQLLFFCGHDPDCLPFDSPHAIQIAKHRIESEFAVVGTWDETNITLTVLEHYIPKYFSGATGIFYMNYDSLINRNRNHNKPVIDDDVRDMIRRNLTNEIEFFQFCKQHLYKQYLAILVDKRI